MRIAIIGNSHAGPLYTAWKGYRRAGGRLAATFFIERSMGTEPLVLRGGGTEQSFEDLLVLSEPVVRVEDHEAFVVVGLGYGLHPVASVYSHVRSDAHSPAAERPLVSEACFTATTSDVLAATKAFRVAQCLRQMTEAPVLLAPQPLPAWWIREFPGTVGDLYREIEDNGDRSRVALDYRRAISSSAGAEVLPQHPATVVDDIFTAPTYTLGDPAVTEEGSGYARGDYYHGNVAWGEHVAAQIDARLVAAVEG